MKNTAVIILFAAIALLFIPVAHADFIGGGAPAPVVALDGSAPDTQTQSTVAPPDFIGGGASATSEPPDYIGGGDAFWVVIKWFFLR